MLTIVAPVAKDLLHESIHLQASFQISSLNLLVIAEIYLGLKLVHASERDKHLSVCVCVDLNEYIIQENAAFKFSYVFDVTGETCLWSFSPWQMYPSLRNPVIQFACFRDKAKALSEHLTTGVKMLWLKRDCTFK